MEYSALTDQIDSLLSVDWTNIAGNLDKVSESSMGAAWGLGGGKLFRCDLPCTGNWVPELDNVLDIATDDSLVYALLNGQLQTKSGNGQGEWTSIPVTVDIQKIFSSGSYIWGQGAKKWKLPKPGTTGNWMEVQDTTGTQITSATQNALYGILNGKAFKTDESLQSSWEELPQFQGMFTGIVGSGGDLYGIDDKKLVHKCVGDSCVTLKTEKPVKDFSVQSKNLWMLSDNPGNFGNIYFKQDERDVSKIVPLDKERDQLVQQAETDYENATYAGMMYKQLEEIRTMFNGLFDPVEPPKQNNHNKIEQLKKGTNLLLVLIIMLVLVLLNYLAFGQILGQYSHVVSLLILITGIFYYTLR
jgi:hypothetical protein